MGSSTPKGTKNYIRHEDQSPEAKQRTKKTTRLRRYSLFPQPNKNKKPPKTDTTTSLKETIPPPIPPKHPGRNNSDGKQNRKTRGSKRISPLASPARAHIPSSTPQYSTPNTDSPITSPPEQNTNKLAAPPSEPKPYLSKSACHIFGLNLPRRPPLGLNIETEYLDETTRTVTFLELWDTVNRTYGSAFDAEEAGVLIGRAKERGALVEVRKGVYRFEGGFRGGMDRWVKERARRKREGG